ncbi:MAG: NAD(P)-dependent oxidoreductase [Acidobacteriales bacterium]|nr:NAD(P)-dependent oxidoreductase [Terriglobales bacterium]
MTQEEHVVVIGGLGFIGRRLTLRLRNAGHSVTVVSRSAASRGTNEAGLAYVSGDVSDAARMAEIIRGASKVFDLSMGGGSTWADYEREVIGGACNVARACLQHGVRRLVYTSSTSALYLGGPSKIDEFTRNDGAAVYRDMYSRGKSLAEDSLLAMHVREQLPVVIVRPGMVLGPGGALVHYVLGERPSDGTCILGWGRGKNPLPCVLVDDVADAMIRASDAVGVDGLVFNLVGDVRPTAAEYVEVLRRRTLRDFRFYPRSLCRIQAGEYARFLMKKLAGRSKVRMMCYRDLKSSSMVAQFDCSLAKRLLGWVPVSDQEEFYRHAIDCHVEQFLPGDLRLEHVG